jgi:DNA-binding transcriptional ArsR family regulator
VFTCRSLIRPFATHHGLTTYLYDDLVTYSCQQIISPQAVARAAGRPGRHRMTTPLYQLKAEFFKTLGHPARIRILELLAKRDHSVGQLQAAIGLEASHTSQQLAILRRAGVVTARKQGNSVIYSMATPDMADLLAVARRVLTGMLNDQVTLLKDLKASSRAAARAAS